VNHDQHLKEIIAELPYWPSASYLANLANTKLLLLENCEHFVKSSNRNRCWIAGANGALLLSIPISGGRSHKQLYREVLTDDAKAWRRQHWQSIKSAYGKSPFFEFYEAEIQALYTANDSLLWDFNLKLLHWLLAKLGMQLPIQCTETFLGMHPENDCRLYGPWQRREIPAYYQCFSEKNGFQTDMAALDLLCNLGPQGARQYLAKLSA